MLIDEATIDIRPWIANGRFEGNNPLKNRDGVYSGDSIQLAVKISYPEHIKQQYESKKLLLSQQQEKEKTEKKEERRLSLTSSPAVTTPPLRSPRSPIITSSEGSHGSLSGKKGGNGTIPTSPR